MFLVLLNIMAGTTAATVYALWASKWWGRHSPGLALLNAAVALVAAGIALTYTLFLLTGNEDALAPLRAVVSLALLLPAITRMFELRREDRREAVAQRLEDELLGAMRNPGRCE